MSRLNDVIPIVERMLEDGIEDRDCIVEVASREIDVDDEELRRVYFTKAVSFAITHIRDGMGRRLVYQIRENGKHLAVHIGRTRNFALVRKIGGHKVATGHALVAEGERLIMISEQIELDFGVGAA